MCLSDADEEFESLKTKESRKPDYSPTDHTLPMGVARKGKLTSDGTVEHLKARISAGGNYSDYGDDYFKTYAPVVSCSLVRISLFRVLCPNMFFAQLDVKTAFLNG